MFNEFDICYFRSPDDRIRVKGQVSLLFSCEDSIMVVLNNQAAMIDAGSFVILREGDSMHCIPSSGQQFRRYELGLSRAYIDRLSSSATDLYECFHYRDVDDSMIVKTSDSDMGRAEDDLSKLLAASESSVYGVDLTCQMLVTDILIIANRSFRSKLGLADKEQPVPDDASIYNIIAYIRDNYWEDITIDRLSIEFHISKNDLCELFRVHTGRSPIQYLIEYRILKAKEFMEKPISVEEVCTKVGFNNYPHFSRTFKKRVGVSPKQYQNIIKYKK